MSVRWHTNPSWRFGGREQVTVSVNHLLGWVFLEVLGDLHKDYREYSKLNRNQQAAIGIGAIVIQTAIN
jgi:hypothetical protein